MLHQQHSNSSAAGQAADTQGVSSTLKSLTVRPFTGEQPFGANEGSIQQYEDAHARHLDVKLTIPFLDQISIDL